MVNFICKILPRDLQKKTKCQRLAKSSEEPGFGESDPPDPYPNINLERSSIYINVINLPLGQYWPTVLKPMKSSEHSKTSEPNEIGKVQIILL